MKLTARVVFLVVFSLSILLQLPALAQAAPKTFTLNISKTGSGSGIVSSLPPGIDCGKICGADFKKQSRVLLTATVAPGSVFQGWTGACAGKAITCTVRMDRTQTVGADFSLTTKVLSVIKTGSGQGTIASYPGGISCGDACIAYFGQDSVITLTATPFDGSTFTGWSGACTGVNSTCSVALNESRILYATFSAPTISTYEYDPNGNLTRKIDPLGNTGEIQYDRLDQVVREFEPHPVVVGSTQGQIDTTYDSLGQVTSITDPRNLITDYQFDSLGNLLSQTSPDSGITNFTYDEAGNVKTRTDARGKTANYRHDSQNRITQIVYEDQAVSYSWDNCTNGIGRLCSLANNGSSLSYSYDSHGRITGKSQTVGGVTLNASHSYNSLGQWVQTVSPGGQTIGYVWLNGRIDTVTVNGQPLISQILYEPDGQIEGWTWGNNESSQRLYDLSGRPVFIDLGFDAPSQLQETRRIIYDASGNITDQMNEIDASANQHHVYDGLNRLIATEQGQPTQYHFGYTYDLTGNRTGKVQNSNTEMYSIDPGSNRLQQSVGEQIRDYSYDAAGNLTGDGTFNYGYNAEGRLISASATGQSIRYGYNALGQRVNKTVNGVTTRYFYDEQGHLIGEYDASGQLLQEIVWLGDWPVAALKPTTSAGATTDIYYIHADHLGTPRKITRPGDNKVLWSWVSESFGDSLPNQNPAGQGSFVFNLRFPGQYYDQETGLHYNYYRDYDPRTGRYIESDPIGLAGGINSYAYAYNNPLRWIDRLGLFVTGDYDSLTGQLTITDQDTGNSVTIQAESGGKPFGDPIPTGAYDILERHGRPDFYRLDKQDSYPYDDVDNITGRDHFRLHRPGRTIGCIAAKMSHEWKQVDELIKNTKQTDTVPDNFKPWWKYWPTGHQELRHYGTLTVH